MAQESSTLVISDSACFRHELLADGQAEFVTSTDRALEPLWKRNDDAFVSTVVVVDTHAQSAGKEMLAILEGYILRRTRDLGRPVCKVVTERVRVLGSPRERVEQFMQRLSDRLRAHPSA